MGASLLITFRESLEASLVIGMVLAMVGQDGRRRHGFAIWGGLAFGIAASLVVAWAFIRFLGQFEGREEQIFEGSTMIVGALLLATLLLWTGSHSSGRKLEGQILTAAEKGWLATGVLVFVSILREGVETVVYLGSSLRDGGPGTFIGGLVGILLAVGLGFLILRGGRRLPASRFFMVTSILFLLFGAGLFARAAGEFGEAGLLSGLATPLWTLAQVDQNGLPTLMSDQGAVGSFMKGLFGYSSSPTLAQLLAWLVYASSMGALLWGRRRRTSGMPSKELNRAS